MYNKKNCICNPNLMLAFKNNLMSGCFDCEIFHKLLLNCTFSNRLIIIILEFTTL